MKNWKENYQAKLCSAEEAVNLIKSGDRVVLSHFVSEPWVLIDAMVANADAYRNVKVSCMQSLGKGSYTRPEYKDNFTYDAWFINPAGRECLTKGYGDTTINFYHEPPEWLREGKLGVDVMLGMVSPPDEYGYCSCGVACDYTYDAFKAAKKIILQVNKNMPYAYGDTLVHVDDCDAIVEADVPLPELIVPEIDEKEIAIGEYCASLIPDGATISLGIGTIPNAVCKSLYNKKDLGVHSDMLTDGIVELYESGVINNSKKSMNVGKMTVSFALGSQKTYNFIDHNPVVQMKDAEYTSHPYLVAKQSKMICINSALNVDFMGQVVSSTLGRYQFSSEGGQPNLMRGAVMSFDRQGKGIIAMKSSVEDLSGKLVSKITPYNAEGAAVSLVREDADYIVTENGIARLRGLPLKERAKKLISISDPLFRDELIEGYEKRFSEKYKKGC